MLFPVSSRAPGRARFTLIELLVVVAVIAILAAMLLPALNRARGMAQRTQCINHQKQIGIASMLYADEHDDHYPYTSFPATNVSWTVTLKPYVATAKFYQCPTDRGARWTTPASPETTGANYYTTSFIMNAWIAPTGKYRKTSFIRSASSMINFVDANTDLTQRDHFHPFYWVNDPDVTYSAFMHNTTWDDVAGTTREIATTRHQGRFGATFADGHVDHLTWDDAYWQDPARGVLTGNFDPRQ